jgi:hypothetical protein
MENTLDEEEEIVLGNGLKAKLRNLKTAPAIAKACRKVRRGLHELTPVISKKLSDYWLIEVPVDGTTVYLVLNDASWLSREELKRWIMPNRSELYSRVLLVVYDSIAYFWAEHSGQIILTALGQKTSPGIVAVTNS